MVFLQEEMEEMNEEDDGLLLCIRMANKSEVKLNEEGKRNLAHDLIEQIPEEKVEEFIKEWGYKKLK